jgi:histidyl-tRNA synthetase
LAGGGRYDNLIGVFLGEEVPACGISLGLERILVLMAERAMFPPELANRPADVMVTMWNAGQIDQSLRLARSLRDAGLRVETYPEADKLGKQFKYASSRGIPFVAIIGDEELANETVAVKNMASGQQQSFARAAVAQEILAKL